MELSGLMITPIALGAMLWIVDMLLPEGRIARLAGAVAAMLALYAMLAPVMYWLGGETQAAGFSARDIMPQTDSDTEPSGE